MTDAGDRRIHISGDNYGPNVSGDGNTVNLGPAPGKVAAEHFAAGLAQLRRGLTTQALRNFDRAIEGDPGNPEVYYLSAVATLGGRKAFAASLEQIRRAEQLIQAAIALDDRAVFHYFLAYLSFDYYHRKSLRAPTHWQLSLARAIGQGITRNDIETLFALLSVRDPWETVR